MNKKFCIFDMDGTLVNSMGYWQRMQEDYLASKNVDSDLADEVIEFVKPLPLLASVKVFIDRCGITAAPEHVMKEMLDIMDGYYRKNVEIKAGADAYLAALKKRGCHCCIASATEAHMVETCLTRLGIRERFDFLLSCADIGIGKDQPDIFLNAAQSLGAKVEETAVFEDSLQAGKTAKQAGFYLVAVYDENSAETWEELSALADEVITDWSAAAAALNGLY